MSSTTPLQRLLLNLPDSPPAPVTREDQVVGLLSQIAANGKGDQPGYIREQYKVNERKHITLPFSPQQPNYPLQTQDAKVIVIITDSVIQWDIGQAITDDSPRLSGNAVTFANFTLGIDFLSPSQKVFYATLVSGSGNIWLLIAN